MAARRGAVGDEDAEGMAHAAGSVRGGVGIEPLLVEDHDGKLEAKTIFEELCRKQPDTFEPGQLRTLQRRMREWRTEGGPEKEVMFPQEHAAGRMGSIDFTHGTELGVTIAGAVFVHLWFELVLAFSGWRFVQLAYGETFEALLAGWSWSRNGRDVAGRSRGFHSALAVELRVGAGARRDECWR